MRPFQRSVFPTCRSRKFRLQEVGKIDFQKSKKPTLIILRESRQSLSILAGDRLRKYFPDVSMTPREIEESVYDALEERRQRQLKAQQKDSIFKKSGPNR